MKVQHNCFVRFCEIQSCNPDIVGNVDGEKNERKTQNQVAKPLS